MIDYKNIKKIAIEFASWVDDNYSSHLHVKSNEELFDEFYKEFEDENNKIILTNPICINCTARFTGKLNCSDSSFKSCILNKKENFNHSDMVNFASYCSGKDTLEIDEEYQNYWLKDTNDFKKGCEEIVDLHKQIQYKLTENQFKIFDDDANVVDKISSVLKQFGLTIIEINGGDFYREYVIVKIKTKQN